jgi:hypothetical protein
LVGRNSPDNMGGPEITAFLRLFLANLSRAPLDVG